MERVFGKVMVRFVGMVGSVEAYKGEYLLFSMPVTPLGFGV